MEGTLAEREEEVAALKAEVEGLKENLAALQAQLGELGRPGWGGREAAGREVRQGQARLHQFHPWLWASCAAHPGAAL